ncbi:hypothetical protein [Marinoscillum pacificum]|uniref:hypothetical protein n=1 Tax=Marinoscillum pacificum TaxID=392723 RepID=UPI00215776E6|nr:hypothetical protein [Marinoscillum pacificum]
MDIGFQGMVIQFSSLLTIDIGSVGIHFSEIENLVSPLLLKYQLPYDKISFTVVNADVGKDLKSYSIKTEEEIIFAIDQAVKHYESFGKDFFNQHVNVQNLLSLLNESEAIPKGGYFTGTEGLFRRLAVSKLSNDERFEERKLKYLNTLLNLCQKSSSFEVYLEAFKDFSKTI